MSKCLRENSEASARLLKNISDPSRCQNRKAYVAEPNFSKLVGGGCSLSSDRDQHAEKGEFLREQLDYMKYIDKEILGGVPVLSQIHRMLAIGKFESIKYAHLFRTAENECQLCNAVGETLLGTIFDDAIRTLGRSAFRCQQSSRLNAPWPPRLIQSSNPVWRAVAVFDKTCKSTLPYVPKHIEKLAGTKYVETAKKDIITKMCSAIGACLTCRAI